MNKQAPALNTPSTFTVDVPLLAVMTKQYLLLCEYKSALAGRSMVNEYEVFRLLSLLYNKGVVHVFSSGLYSIIQCFSPFVCWLVKMQRTVEVSRSKFTSRW